MSERRKCSKCGADWSWTPGEPDCEHVFPLFKDEPMSENKAKFKGTPGPWEWMSDLGRPARQCSGIHPVDHISYALAYIPFEYEDYSGPREGRATEEVAAANAALIAAAPGAIPLAEAVARHFKDTDAPLGQMARDWLAQALGTAAVAP